ncbi:major surface lipoprotein LipL32 [Aquimarina addita]|uniref:Major surface lipoprotein LipL32 n=1 Tax=Aquimarina addita TaxID=870485 RepID=A0ABP7X9C2_9FLAO
MKTKIAILFVLAALGSNFNAQAQKFGSSISKEVMGKTIRVPYTDVVSYLGHAEAGAQDEVKDGKNFYYIYVWVPVAAPELGVRMTSPAGKRKIKNAIVSEDYTANAGSTDSFDTYITLERSTILSKSNITEESVAGATWFTLAQNDDSEDGSKKGSNSLLRHKTDIKDPLSAITVGLYRIGFTTFKAGDVKGTFLAEIGSPVKLPGVVMAKTVEGLNAALAAAK